MKKLTIIQVKNGFTVEDQDHNVWIANGPYGIPDIVKDFFREETE